MSTVLLLRLCSWPAMRRWVAVLVFGIGLTAALPLAALILRRHPEPRAV